MNATLRSIVVSVSVLFLSGYLSAAEPAPSKNTNANSDQNAIINTVLDYVEGWYSADAKRMDRALSQHLAKRRITSDGEMMAVTKEWMVRETGKGLGQIPNPEQGKKDVTILDQTENLASVMLVSNEYVDYLHLVKIGDSWKIVNALWDYRAK